MPAMVKSTEGSCGIRLAEGTTAWSRSAKKRVKAALSPLASIAPAYRGENRLRGPGRARIRRRLSSGRRHAHDGLVQLDAAGRPEELRVAVGEDPAVGGHEPVPTAVRRRRHADHGLV